MISDIELLKLLNGKLEVGPQIIMDNYKTLIYKIILNKFSNMYSKRDIEEYVSYVFFKVFCYKNRIDTEKSFIEIFLAIIAKRKVMDMYRQNKNNNQIPIDDVSVPLHTIEDNVEISLVSSILLKDRNSLLIDTMKSFGEPDSEIILRKYYLNQRLKDISKNVGLKVSTYA